MKYMGSKARIAKHIIPHITEHLNGRNYFVDAFCGGCNLIDKIDYPNKIASDNNHYLIAMLQELQMIGMEKLPTTIPKEMYDRARKEYREGYPYPEDIAWIGWVGFMASVNGRFFAGGYSGHNVKVKGGERNYIAESIRNIQKQMPLLEDIVFLYSEYHKLCLPSNSVIYCDPPYKGTKEYEEKFDHDKFWQWCRNMTAEGHKVFVSEYQAPDDFECVMEIPLTNSMATKNTYKPTEKLFTL